MLVQIASKDKIAAIFKVIENVRVEDTGALAELGKLPRYTLDGIEPVPEGMFENTEDSRFSVAVTFSVLLHGSLFAAELFPGIAQGRFLNNVAIVDKLTVDVSSFFE